MRRTRTIVALLAAAFVLPDVAGAQFSLAPGRLSLGGSASFVRSTTKVNGESADPVTQVSVTPEVAYFIRYGLSVGAIALIQYQSQGDFSSVAYGMGPSVTYYFGRSAQRLHPFVGGALLLVRGGGEAPGVDPPSTTTLGYQAGVGLLYLFSRNAGVNAQLYHRRDNVSAGDDELRVSAIGLAVGISAFAF